LNLFCKVERLILGGVLFEKVYEVKNSGIDLRLNRRDFFAGVLELSA
jgi:hypothetical protein